MNDDGQPSLFLRIDDRLIHGQVVTAWVQALKTKSLYIISDRAANEPLEVILLQSSVPRHLTLEVATVTTFLTSCLKQAPDKSLLLLERIEDVLTICSHCPSIREVNLGGLRFRPGKKSLSRSVYVSAEESALLRQLSARGIQVFLQIVPADSKVLVTDKILHQ